MSHEAVDRAAPAAVTARCPSCASCGVQTFYEVAEVPVNSCILLATADEALRYPRGDVRLAFCPSCGFIFNSAFDPKLSEYSARYEETQGFSPTFNAFHRRLAGDLVARYGLRGKKVIEIGCGKGEFLNLLCELGVGEAVGFDPSHVPGRNEGSHAERIRFVEDFYSERYTNEAGDFVCCKMTLEHIAPTSEFVSMVRRSIGDRADCVTYFLVPDAHRIVHDVAFEDVYYEHCSYFSRGSLARLFSRSGFEILNMSTEYDGQYLAIEARPRASGAVDGWAEYDDLKETTELVASFPRRCAEKVARWRETVQGAAAAGRRVVLWGSGSKAVSFLTTLKLAREIEHVVDINPFRQGCFMPITAERIVAPEFLRGNPPDLVIVMNAVYVKEIQLMLARLGLDCEVRAL